MNAADRSFLTKELTKASAAFDRAIKTARALGDERLARVLEKQQVGVAAEITTINGGPVKLSPLELLSTFRS